MLLISCNHEPLIPSTSNFAKVGKIRFHITNFHYFISEHEIIVIDKSHIIFFWGGGGAVGHSLSRIAEVKVLSALVLLIKKHYFHTSPKFSITLQLFLQR